MKETIKTLEEEINCSLKEDFINFMLCQDYPIEQVVEFSDKCFESDRSFEENHLDFVEYFRE